MGKNNCLVIGSGGREHAIAYKLSLSDAIETVFVAPGNGGTSSEDGICNVQIDVNDHAAVVQFCLRNKVDLVCVGPEVPLVDGIADSLRDSGILCFGPGKVAAQLEGSKAFSKDFMARNSIPTATYRTFSQYKEAVAYIEAVTKTGKVVVKASGLAAGKGVLLPETTAEAVDAVKRVMVDLEFGKEAGSCVVIEEFMEGPEVSIFAFCDGTNIALLPASQDHKRIFDGDLGPNTGGMGAYCPAPVYTEALAAAVKRDIVQKSVSAAKREGFPFIGLLYVGIMLTKQGPKVLEYNCRFGDPETEAVLMLLESDLYEVMRACASEDLRSVGDLKIKSGFAATVVAASEGYPGNYTKGKPITGLEKASQVENVKVFHAGTTVSEGIVRTSGGRVLAVSATGDNLSQTLKSAYTALGMIEFDGMQYRRDIGHRALKPNWITQLKKVEPTSWAFAGSITALFLFAILRRR